ncbi:sugar dehydrogenase complex small subunit (plasmid) [Thioclava sp. 'Guangxiensis']|uniref:sugar dehydrogenase complex small subunit n=1 Tax=Thioclava sp. 'Guangxiensis' TaxID=3149044 RepID=UPI0032C3D62D
MSTLVAPKLASAAALGSPDADFMAVSQLLVNHDLNPAVGARIAAFAVQNQPDLQAMLKQISDIAASKNATTVEDFYDDLPEGATRDFAHWIIESWYTGSSSNATDATLFTYEEALLYRPTFDMVPIPTFGYSAPNAWGQDLSPLSAMPRF